VPPEAVDVNGMLSAGRALVHVAAGEREEARALIEAATSHAVDTQESHHATYLVAVAHARMGDLDESLRWLRFTAANGYPCYPLFAEGPLGGLPQQARRLSGPSRRRARPRSGTACPSPCTWDVGAHARPIAPLNAALECRYRVERQLGEGDMAVTE
jgi:hypothetical protein